MKRSRTNNQMEKTTIKSGHTPIGLELSNSMQIKTDYSAKPKLGKECVHTQTDRQTNGRRRSAVP